MAAQRRAGTVLTGWPALVLSCTTAIASAQAPSPGALFDQLSAMQQRVLVAVDRGGYDGWSAPSREAFDRLTRQLSALVLSDPENGEVLGAALELIDSMEQPARAGAIALTGETWRVRVGLAAGARDALRRSAEFALDSSAPVDAPAYVHRGTAAIRITITSRTAGEIEIGW